jgi:uncharacterized protein YjhX (UPF0386 family)
MAGSQLPSIITVYSVQRHQLQLATGGRWRGSREEYLVVFRSVQCIACLHESGAVGDIAVVVDGKTLKRLVTVFQGRPVNTSKLGPGMPLKIGRA